MIIGTVSNSATVEIDFPFFTGIAGARELGDGRLQVACPVVRLALVRGEGTIAGEPYTVEGSPTASTVKGMALLVVRPADQAIAS